MHIKDKINGGNFDGVFEKLYGDIDSARARFCNAVDCFDEYFQNDGERFLFSAPGRTEVGGNHTDHQHGCVLAGSVNLDVIAVVSKNDSGMVRIKSEGFDMDEVSITDLAPNNELFGKSSELIKGMLYQLQLAGYSISGFDAYTTSNVLKGSGLSSSAAFEVLVGVIISGLYNDGGIDAVEIAKMAQKAENLHFGKPCGLMDQMACSVGGFTAIDFSDVHNPVIEKVDFDLSSEGYSLCIVNTGGNHADLTDDYAGITVECRQISEFFGKEFLRDVNPTLIYDNILQLRECFGDRAVLRAIHFFDENKRAVDEKNALVNKEFDKFLDLVKKSGNSSYKYLQNVYSVSSPKQQGLSLALALAEKVLGDRGAFRVHGGGFAGTIQAFVPNELLNSFLNTMRAAFSEDSCFVLNIRPLGGVEIK